MCKSRLFLIVAILSWCGSSQAAVTARWLGGTGNWGDASKWDTGVVPRNNFPAGTTYAVDLGGGFGVNVVYDTNLHAEIDSLAIGNGATLTLGNNQDLTIALSGNLRNEGEIVMQASSQFTSLEFKEDISLTGGGKITMNAGNGGNVLVGDGVGPIERLTNIDNTIAGHGQIGRNAMVFTNQGTVDANLAGKFLSVDPNTEVINTGTMKSSNGGSLVLQFGTFNNANGLIRADSTSGDSILSFDNAIITGGTIDLIGPGAGTLHYGSGVSFTEGTLNNNATGTLLVSGGSRVLGGNVTNTAGGKITIANNGQLKLLGGAGHNYVNNGDISLNATSASSSLVIEGDVTLNGTGTLTMNPGNGGNLINGVFATTPRFTNNGNTITGDGRIGASNMSLLNRGTIRADIPSKGFLFDIGDGVPFINEGIVHLAAGSGASMGNGDVYIQTGGTTIIDGVFNLVDNTTMQLQGGTLGGSGTITGHVNNSGGTVAPGNSPGILNETGNYAQGSNGTLRVELNGTSVGTGHDQLNVAGTVNLAGTITATSNFTPALGASFVILNNNGTDAVTGTFNGRPEGAVISAGNLLLRISYVGGDGNDVTLTRVNPPTISINDITVTEGTGGAKNANFTLTLSFASPQTVSVNAITANGTAKSPGDFTATGQTISFAPGQTAKVFSGPLVTDTTDEENETLFALLSSPVNAAVLRGRGLGTINDDDAAPSITIDNLSIGEGNSGQRTAVFTLRLSQTSGKAVKVNYATGIGTATAGNDYVAVAPTQVTFNVGSTVTLARVLINGDLLNEPNETFLVNLSSPIHATIADNQAVGTILNDDSAPALSINDVSITEGNVGTKQLTFTVTLSKASGQTVSVNFSTANGTAATANNDYVANNGSLSFAPGTPLTRTLHITINGDTAVEGNETLFVFLSGQTNASVSKARGIGTINNDDNSG